MNTKLPWFTDDEIDNLCDGYKMNAAKVRYLRNLGLIVSRKPNGRPLVIRSHAENVLAGLKQFETRVANLRAAAKPNRDALVARFSK